MDVDRKLDFIWRTTTTPKDRHAPLTHNRRFVAVAPPFSGSAKWSVWDRFESRFLNVSEVNGLLPEALTQEIPTWWH